MKKILSLLFSIICFQTAVLAQGPGCPNINAGADQTMPCNATCTILNATMFQTGATTSYTVSSIPYAPPSPSSAWTNTFVNIDDVWSGVINLPFTFCYYGTNYTQLVVGANGLISFNTGYANQFCPWSYTAAIPSAALPLNSIFGAYHDMDPSVCGNIRYAISGTFPCRTFMFDFNQVCLFNCTNQRTTQRIVLYETSNVIEVYIGSKPACTSWNGGRAVIGIQNAAGDIGVVAPGRQTGSWTATNEAWRFTPSGTPNYQVNWYSSTTPGLIGTGSSVNVCPSTQFTTYSAILTYTNCNGAQVTVSDYVNVTMNGPAQPPIWNNAPICAGNTLLLNTQSVAGATYHWTGPGGWTSNQINPSRTGATTAMSGTYTLYVVVAGCTSSTASQTITILNNSVQPTFTTNSPICAGTTLMFNGPTFAGASYFWNGPGGWTSSVEDPTRASATAAMSGVYSLYVVVSGCTSATATQNVVINAAPAAPIISSNTPVCTPNSINLFGPTVAGATYLWTGPGGWTSNMEDPTRPNANTSMTGTYSLRIVVASCTSAVSNINVVVNGPPIPVANLPQQICQGQTANLLSGTYPGSTYVWSGPNGFTSSVESPVIANVGPANTGNYSLYLVQSGCTSVTSTSYMEVTSTTAPLVASNSPICQGATLNLTANTITGATYYWTGPNGFSSSLEDPVIMGATSANSGTYSLYTISNGCTSATATTNVTVNPTPTVNPVGSQTICNGSQTATINFGGAVAGTTYNWTNNTPSIGLASSGNGNIASFNAVNTGTSDVVATITVTPTANGCSGTPITFTITVRPTPSISTINSQNVCNGAMTSAVTFAGPIAGTTYTWTNNTPSIGLAANGTGNIAAFTATNSGSAPVTATITVNATANGCVATPVTFTITVSPTPTVNPIGNQAICNGVSSTAINFGGNVSGTTYSWTNTNPAIGIGASGNGDIPIFTATNSSAAPINGTFTVTPSINGCTGSASTFTITVNPTPTVDAVPDQTLCHGNNTAAVNYTGNVAGTTYTWTNSTTSIGLAGSGTGNIASFTANNTGTSPVTANITATPSANSCIGLPRNFTITVNPIPTVNTVNNQTICHGATTTAVNFTGHIAGTTYNWTNSNVSIGLAASGNGNIPAFTATNTTTAPITATITATPTINGCTGTPTTFTITVNPTPTVDNILAQNLCNNASTTAINFTNPVAGTSYVWTNSNASIGLAASGNGNIPAFTATNTGNVPATATISVTPTANGCSGPVNTFTITVNPTPTVDALSNQIVCNGNTTAAVTFNGNVTGTSYSWTNTNTSIGLAASGTGNIPAFTTFNDDNAPTTATITVTPSANGCMGSATSFTITVSPTPDVSNIANQTLCNGATTAAVTINGSVAGTTYSWTNNNASIGLGASGTGNIPAFTATNNGNTAVTSTITITPSASTCVGTTRTFTITVNPTPTVDAVADQVRCNNASTAAVSFNGNVAGTSFDWTNTNTAIGLAASGNGNIGSFPATNTGNTSVTGTITVTPSADGCTGSPETFDITVNPTPSVDAINDQVLCNGATTTAVTFINPVAGTTYAWSNDNTSIGLASSGNGNIAAFTATNTGTAPVTASISITPTANACTGPIETFTITVNPTATVNVITNQTVCNGAAVSSIPFSSPTTGTTYTWTNNDASIGLATSGNGDITSFNGINTSNSPITATITVTPTANGCAGTVRTFTITVNPTPTVDNVADQTLCNGTPSTAVTFTNPVAGTTYAWTNNDASINLPASGNGNIGVFNAVNNGTAPVTATITITPTANACTGPTNTFDITVNPTPTVDDINDQTLCNAANTAAVNFTSTVTGSTYAWTNSNTNIGLAASGNGNIGSFVATNTGNGPISSTISITPTANACVGPVNTFDIIVNPTPSADDVTDQVLCNTATTNPVNFTSPVVGTTYAWTNNEPSIGLATAGNGNIASFAAINGGTTAVISTISVTPTANNCVGTVETFTITVNPTPTVNGVNDQTHCNGAPTAVINFNGAVSNTTYNWTNDNTTIGLAGTGSGDIASFNTTNTGNTPVTANIIITPTASSCSGATDTFSIIVNPTPMVDAVNDQTLCNTALTNAINFNGNVAGSSFDWTNTETSIGLPSTGNGNIAPFAASNGGNAPVTATITVTPSANNCLGVSDTFTITVNPTPNATNLSDQTVCNGATTNAVNFTGDVANTSFSWTNSDASIGLAASGNGNIAAFTGTNTGATPVTSTITVTPTANNCVGPDSIFTITVNPATTVNPVSNQTICNGASVSVAFSGAANNSTFAWTNDNTSIGLAASGIGDIAAFNATNTGTSPITANLSVTPTANGCTGPTENFSILVNPTPSVVQTPPAAACNGENTTAIAFNGPVAGTTYAWTNTNASIGLAASGTGNIPVFVATNPGSSSQAELITVTPSANGCTGANMMFTYTIHPTYTGGQSAVICNGDTYTFGTQSFTTAGQYPVLFQSINGCDSTVTLDLTVNPTYNYSFSETICQGSVFNFAGNDYSTTGNYPVNFQTINGCDSTVTLNLTVTPNPIVNIAPQAAQCSSGNSFNFSAVQTYPAGALFNWTFVGSNMASSTVVAPQNIIYPAAGTYIATLAVEVDGCQGYDTLTINVLQTPTAQFNASPTAGCIPLVVNFTNLTAGGGTASWDFGNGNTSTNNSPTEVYTLPGVYTVSLTATSPNGCSATQTISGLINTQAPPMAGFSVAPAIVYMDDPTIYVTDLSTGSSNVVYTISGTTTTSFPGPDLLYKFMEEGEYLLTQVVSSTVGCTDTAYGKIVVNGITEIFIPNAFSPNADPMNPNFGVIGRNFSEFQMLIFNRWGELLFESRNPDYTWDGTYGGKPVPIDVYVYKVQLRDFKNKQQTYIGSVTLIR